MGKRAGKRSLVGNLSVQPGGKAVVIGSVEHLEIRSALTDDQRVRLRLLKRVKEDWVDGFLRQSYYRTARISIALSDRSSIVACPPRSVVKVPDWLPTELPQGAGVAEIFDFLGQALLISGGPGVGKTTLLLELCEKLIDRALEDDGQPIPVVFHLSTWALKRQPLLSWLIAELKWLGVPDGLPQKWIGAGAILPLLDGLDEVRAHYRSDCLQAISAFRDRWGLCPMALSSRTDSVALSQQLRMGGLLTLHPFTSSQVDTLLSQNPDLRPLQSAAVDKPWLTDLLATPLMLWVASLAYRGKSLEIATDEGPEQTQRRFVSTFVDMQLSRGSIVRPFSQADTLRWLSWLAVILKRNNRTVFYLEDLSPNWLGPSRYPLLFFTAVKLVYSCSCAFVVGLAGGFVSGLSTVLDDGWHQALAFGWSEGLWVGVVAGFFFGIISSFTDLRPVEALQFRFAGDRTRVRRAIRAGLIFSFGVSLLFLLVGLIVSLVASAVFGAATNDMSWLLVPCVVLGMLIGSFVGVVNLVNTERPALRKHPNQGTYASVRRALGIVFISAVLATVIGAIGGSVLFPLVAWKVFPFIRDPIFMGLNGPQLLERVQQMGGLKTLFFMGIQAGGHFGLNVGLILGLFGGMISGGGFAIRHLVTRLSVWLNHESPLAYGPFLDYAVDRLFLFKLTGGGGYLFAHEILSKYFASIHGEVALGIPFSES